MTQPEAHHFSATYDYALPPDRIAQKPAARREDARLLAVGPAPKFALTDQGIRDFPALLHPDDLLIINDTKVRKARLWGERESTGGRAEILFLNLNHQSCEVLLKTRGKPLIGEQVRLMNGRLSLTLEQSLGEGRWRVSTTPTDPVAVEGLLEEGGRMPLPPYIQRDRESDSRDALDRERYQTVFADQPGAAAAPTAGLHLTPGAFDQLQAAGIEVARVTLQVGLGTFRPLQTDDVRDHPMHSERWTLPHTTADAIAACRARGGRVVAVGTTSVRTLETAADGQGGVRPGAGTTKLMIHPGYRFQVVDSLLTNFHAPRSTLLLIIAAILGLDGWRRAYDHALAGPYRFLSYGDAMWLSEVRGPNAGR